MFAELGILAVIRGRACLRHGPGRRRPVGACRAVRAAILRHARITRGTSLLREQRGHVLRGGGEDLVGRLAVESAVRHDGVVVVDVEGDESGEGGDRVQAPLE